MDLTEAATALYAELPSRFIAERTAAVRRAKEGGDKELAALIGRLAKPSVAAWAVNALARERGELMEAFAELGSSLREAQEDLDSDALRTLTQQRRRLVEQLAAEAQRLGERLGQPVSAAAREDVEQTLQAGLADPAASDAIRTGRLIRPLSTSGFDPVELDGAVAGDPTAAAPPSTASATKTESRDDLEEARKRKAAELQERREEKERADAEAGEAAAVLADLESRHDAARAARDSVRDRVDAVRRELDELEDELTRGGAEVRRLRGELDDAEDALDRARRRAERAGERLASLERRGRR